MAICLGSWFDLYFNFFSDVCFHVCCLFSYMWWFAGMISMELVRVHCCDLQCIQVFLYDGVKTLCLLGPDPLPVTCCNFTHSHIRWSLVAALKPRWLKDMNGDFFFLRRAEGHRMIEITSGSCNLFAAMAVAAFGRCLCAKFFRKPFHSWPLHCEPFRNCCFQQRHVLLDRLVCHVGKWIIEVKMFIVHVFFWDPVVMDACKLWIWIHSHQLWIA